MEKKYVKAIYCLTAYSEYIMQNPRLDASQTRIISLGEISTTSDMEMIPL